MIRRATPFDSAAILHCLAQAFAPFRDQYSAAAFADTTLTPETIPQRLTAMSVFVAAHDDGQIIGTIACAVIDGDPDEGHLRGMAVLPEHQGKRVSEALLLAAEAELRVCGCTRVTLDTTAPLRRAIRFYERNGYRATGKVADFYGMPLYEYAKAL